MARACPTMRGNMATKKRKATVRQTGDDVASIAGELLALLRSHRRARIRIEWATGQFIDSIDVTARVKALAASCLSQDQTKGRRK